MEDRAQDAGRLDSDEYAESATKQHINELVRALLAREPVAGTIVDELPEADIQAVAGHPAVTWAVLCEQPDRDAAMRLLEHRIQSALVGGRAALIAAELDVPELVRDAVDQPVLEGLVLRAIAALAWDDPTAGRHWYGSFVGEHRDDELDAVRSACEHVLAMAPTWRSLCQEQTVPEPLVRFVQLQWVASAATHGELIAALRHDMTARPAVYLDVLDIMAAHYIDLLRYLAYLAERLLPESPPSLGELDEDEHARLSRAISDIDAPIATGVRFSHLLIAAVSVGALLSLGGYDNAAMVAAVLLVAAGSGYIAWSEKGMYGRFVRPPLAAYLADVGTPIGCVVSWLLLNRKAVKKVKAFDVAIDADAALATMARLGRMTRLYGASV